MIEIVRNAVGIFRSCDFAMDLFMWSVKPMMDRHRLTYVNPRFATTVG